MSVLVAAMYEIAVAVAVRNDVEVLLRCESRRSRNPLGMGWYYSRRGKWRLRVYKIKERRYFSRLFFWEEI